MIVLKSGFQLGKVEDKQKKEIIMDTNTLIEIIKNGTPIVQSSLSAIVGAVISTLF